jgi:hypothetical protein
MEERCIIGPPEGGGKVRKVLEDDTQEFEDDREGPPEEESE